MITSSGSAMISPWWSASNPALLSSRPSGESPDRYALIPGSYSLIEELLQRRDHRARVLPRGLAHVQREHRLVRRAAQDRPDRSSARAPRALDPRVRTGRERRCELRPHTVQLGRRTSDRGGDGQPVVGRLQLLPPVRLRPRHEQVRRQQVVLDERNPYPASPSTSAPQTRKTGSGHRTAIRAMRVITGEEPIAYRCHTARQIRSPTVLGRRVTGFASGAVAGAAILAVLATAAQLRPSPHSPTVSRRRADVRCS